MLDFKKEGQINLLLDCILRLQKRGDNFAVINIFSQLFIQDETLAINLVKKTKKRNRFATCGYFISQKRNRKKFSLLCLNSWGKELIFSLEGIKLGGVREFAGRI